MKFEYSSEHLLWDHLDEVTFWIKDLEGRFVWVNTTLAGQAQCSREDLIGTRDSDWFRNELASVYMEDDAMVVESGQEILNKPELVVSPDGEVRWHATSKYPYRNREGEVVGSCGMSQPMETEGNLPAEYADLSLVVNYARQNLASGVTVQDLGRIAHVSLSTLERTVQRHLRITPQELLRRVTMNRARHLLTTSALQVGEVARECGYESFSAFSRAFKKAHGHPPGSLRSHMGSLPRSGRDQMKGTR